MTDELPTFRTKTGVCTIAPDRLVLSRIGKRGALAEMLVGRSVRRVLWIYSLVAIALAYLAVNSFRNGDTAVALGLALISAVLIRGVLRSKNVSAVSEILIATVRDVEAHPPRAPLVRGYFVVTFEHLAGTSRRLIILPGTLSGGAAEYERATTLLRAAGMLK